MREFTAQISKRGIPCLWEQGGGYSNTGDATIITGHTGAPKTAIYTKKGGQLACGEHALIPVKTDDHIIMASHHRGDFTITIYRIVMVQDGKVMAMPINHFSEGEWDVEPKGYLNESLIAVQQKAQHYHCRHAYFTKQQEELY